MNRHHFLLSLALLVLLASLFMLPAVHWRLIGWWRGEAFYQERPTSYWREEVDQFVSKYLEERDRARIGKSNPFDCCPPPPLPTAQDKVLRFLGVSDIHVAPAILNVGPIANPVLKELLQDGSRGVRLWAALALAESCSEPEAVVPVLGEMLKCDDADTLNILMSLRKYGSDARGAVPAILPLLSHDNERMRMTAGRVLGAIDPGAAAKVGVK